ncbi:MAG: ATP-binding cassette domain-containing protein [Lachnospiraceae bacterium]|nr:ATP-binding cassette domain-containing protein [Lachnospiraceae bacterium]
MISVEHIAKTYKNTEPETEVFRDFSMQVEKGEFVVLTGESGSGKSTLIKMLLLEEKPDAGKIYVSERPIDRVRKADIPNYRQSVGVIFQDFLLIRDRTVYENINLARIITGASQKDSSQRVYHVAKLLGITDLLKRYPHEISGGEQQKVCMARAIVNNPKILLADEPTANLDPSYSEMILKLMQVINDQGTTLLVATQDPIIASYEGARVVSLDDVPH